MGTNYYVKGVGPDPDSGEAELHIGKSSAGWRFNFHQVTFGANRLDNAVAWYRFLAHLDVVDEYGAVLDRDTLFALVARKQDGIYDGHVDADGHSFHAGEFC